MNLPALISDLAIILLTGGVVTVLFKKLNLPIILGYILAGFLIGPYLPYFFTVEDMDSVKTWSEIGIIVMMFCLGLEFNLHKLLRVGGTAVITALTVICGMMLFGFVTGQLLGFGTMDCLFLGGMLSMSSTTIIIKSFDELGIRKEGFAQLVFGTLVVEDIAGIFMMIILSTLSVSRSISGIALVTELGFMVLYLAVWLLLGIYLIPTLLNKASDLLSDETLLIVSLGLCFGMVLLADALGFSSALGAFLAGSLLAGTIHGERVEQLTSGVKNLFGTVFFISVGMMLDPAVLREHWLSVLVIAAVTIIGQFLFATLGTLLSGQSLRSAVNCGCSMAQIGEFAFIIASLGLSLGVIADYIYPVIIAVSVITTLTTPFMIRGADRTYRLTERLLPRKLTEKLRRYTSDRQSDREQDSDWILYLRRTIRVTLLYGAIMFGLSLMGRMLLLPLLEGTGIAPWLCKLLSLAAVYFGMALFIRPMLDLHSPRFTALWMKKQSFRPPLIALSVLRGMLIVLIAFVALSGITGISGLWVLPFLGLAVFFAGRFGWFSSAYLSVEARFLANLNERQLRSLADSGDTGDWLDEKLLVASFHCTPADNGKTLKRLGWGRLYGVNVIRLTRGKRCINMPSGNIPIHTGETVYAIGTAENFRSLAAAGYIDRVDELPTLRRFIGEQGETENALYSYALAVDKTDDLAGKSIKDSGLRERYDCMILGLQRNHLPIVSPDVNLSVQGGDIVWILGTHAMASRILSATTEETEEE